MNFKRVYAIVLRQYFLISSSAARLIPIFLWAGIQMVLWGFITKFLNDVSGAGFNFIPALLGAVLLWELLARIMHSIAIAFLEDVWSRNFLNFFTTPLLISEYLTGLVITGLLVSSAGLFMMVLLAVSFGLSFAVYGSMLMPFLLILVIFGMALGIFGSAIVLRLGPASEWFMWPIPAVISPFAGVFYPLSVLPQWMQYLAAALPPSYVFEGMRAAVLTGDMAFTPLLTGFVLALIYLALACWFFMRVYRHAERTGLIARYSAESLG